MVSTEKQIQANRVNALKSTGPETDSGKLKVSSNAIRHGILSSKLILKGENEEDFRGLVGDLIDCLKPSGALELVLVEKIAVTIWRQRRSVRAETATIELGINTKRIANAVESGMGLSGYGDEKFCANDLEPPDQKQIAWCQAVVAECEGTEDLSLRNLQNKAPLIFEQLTREAEEDQETIAQYLVNSSIEEYTEELLTWCRDELTKLEKRMEQYPTTIAMVLQAKDKLSIPWSKLEVFNKYQTTLDNQLYKAMKALREAQEWRLKTIEVEPTLDTESGVEAA